MARSVSLTCVGVFLAGGLSSLAVVGAADPVGAATSACRPAINDLGDPFGGGLSFADGINATGDIAGSALLPDGSGRAVLWHGGRAINLGVIGKYDESFAHDISDDGTVVGELNFQQRRSAPFIYAHGKMRKLPGLGGGFGYAYGINRSDVIVGAASDATGRPHAVIWTDDGRVVHDLGVASGDESSFGNGINNANAVVGDTDDADENERPAVFAGGGITVLTTKKTAFGSAEDINDKGKIVGTSFLANGDEHATFWGSPGLRGRDLGVLPGGSAASLVDIDNAGQAVGGGNIGDTTHPIFWPGAGALQMLTPLSGDPADFGVARNLDTHGTAVGGSTNRDGDTHATVWTCAAAQAVSPPSARQIPTSTARTGTIPAAMTR